MNSYKSYSGKQYILANVLGSGGEGTVYNVRGDSSIVAKIYKDGKFHSVGDRQTMERKLKTMINMNIPPQVDGILRLAWPLDILYFNGSFVGFIMPAVKAECKIFDVQRADPCGSTPSTGKDKFSMAYPNYTWKYHVQFAYNLAWVIKYLHNYNVVVGDLNPNNIYADTRTGAIVLIDCDSFDINDPITGEHFPCVVGLPELLAPELQNVHHLSHGTFTKETDNFSLAIHIFRLLMRNADPFGGVMTIKRSSSAISANAAIINGECVYVRRVQNKDVPMWSPTLDMLPVNIQELFKNTFEYDALTAPKRVGNRATASEWSDALWNLAKAEPNRNLQKCNNNSRHVYPATSTYCPWCRIQQTVQKQTAQVAQQQTIQQQPLQITQQHTVQQQVIQIAQQPTNSVQPRRSPYLFYIVLVIFGLASGFTFGDVASLGIDSVFGIDISVEFCTMFLSLVGVISGVLIAHHFKDRYVYDLNAVPWLMLGIAELFIPLLIAAIVGFVVFVVLAILYVTAVIIGFILFIIFFTVFLLKR